MIQMDNSSELCYDIYFFNIQSLQLEEQPKTPVASLRTWNQHLYIKEKSLHLWHSVVFVFLVHSYHKILIFLESSQACVVRSV